MKDWVLVFLVIVKYLLGFAVLSLIISGFIYETFFKDDTDKPSYKIEVVDKYEQLDGGFTILGCGTHSNVNYYITYKVYPNNEKAKTLHNQSMVTTDVKQDFYRRVHIGDTRITDNYYYISRLW